MPGYQGQAVLVTGGASGIGLALARALHAHGAKVVLADVQKEKLEAARAELGTNAEVIECDLADIQQQESLIEKAAACFGRLDLVCSNAGIGHSKRILAEPFGDPVRRLFEINFFAGLRLAQAYHGWLATRSAQGRILLTASENALSVPSAVKGARLGLYAASKHGLLIAAEWLRDETAGGPMSVHVLLPGAVYTPLIARNLPDPEKAPPALNLIMPERCAEIALKGLELGLFYIPTQAHLAEDMKARSRGVEEALVKLVETMSSQR